MDIRQLKVAVERVEYLSTKFKMLRWEYVEPLTYIGKHPLFNVKIEEYPEDRGTAWRVGIHLTKYYADSFRFAVKAVEDFIKKHPVIMEVENAEGN